MGVLELPNLEFYCLAEITYYAEDKAETAKSFKLFPPAAEALVSARSLCSLLSRAASDKVEPWKEVSGYLYYFFNPLY